jgi:hypothetical protein
MRAKGNYSLNISVGNPTFDAAGISGGALYLDGWVPALLLFRSHLLTSSSDSSSSSLETSLSPSNPALFPAPTGGSPYMVSTWIKGNTTAGYLASGIVLWYGNTSTEAGLEFNCFRSDADAELANDWGGGNDLPASGQGIGSLYDGNWHRIVGLWDGTVRSLYLDGALFARDRPNTPRFVSEIFSVGTSPEAYFDTSFIGMCGFLGVIVCCCIY